MQNYKLLHLSDVDIEQLQDEAVHPSVGHVGVAGDYVVLWVMEGVQDEALSLDSSFIVRTSSEELQGNHGAIADSRATVNYTTTSSANLNNVHCQFVDVIFTPRGKQIILI